jgi:hypothetical protein
MNVRNMRGMFTMLCNENRGSPEETTQCARHTGKFTILLIAGMILLSAAVLVRSPARLMSAQ